ncbi:hypothetical protein D3C81_1822990 [compost metagenome]
MLMLLSLACIDRLFQIMQDVIDRLCSYRQADQAWRNTGCFLFILIKLLMRCASRMNNQGFRIAHIRKM